MGSNIKDRLFEVADRQQGYFTSQQAETCGYHRSHFHRFLDSGEWVKEIRGVYRLTRYPIQDRPELVLWTLWSRNKQGVPQGVWSHETALDIHELSDIMPAKMHMTVPKNFRRRIEKPKLLCLHYNNLKKQDIEERQGYKVTTPLKTIIDSITVGTVTDDLISQALRQALKRGLVLQEELKAFENSFPKTYVKVTRLLNGYNF